MADLDLSTLKAYTPLFPMLIKKYEQFVPDQNASVLDKINSIIAELNAIGQLSNNVVKDWNTVYQWCMNDGLQTDVNNKLEDMRTNGEISDILSNIFDNLTGDMTTLHTEAKDKLVNSINEVDDLAKLNQTNIGDLTTLTTADKGNLVAAINNNVASLAQNTSLINDITVSVKDKQFGAKGDGVTDDTTAIQNAINYCIANHYRLNIPSGTYMIKATSTDTTFPVGTNGGGLQINGALHLIISRYATLKAITGNQVGYTILGVSNTSNVIIEGGGTIQGERDTHIGTTGSFGYGINIMNSSYVVVRNLTVKNCWGDGIYIDGSYTSPVQCQNILIENVTSDNNRRQGMTIGYANNVVVKNSRFTNTNGTAPMAGIDIEPDHGGIATNIMIDSCYFGGNLGFGVDLGNSSGCDNVKIIGCNFDIPDTSPQAMGVCAIGISDHLTIANNTFIIANNGYGVDVSSTNAVVSNNHIYSKTGAGTALYCSAGSKAVKLNIHHNIVYNVDLILNLSGTAVDSIIMSDNIFNTSTDANYGFTISCNNLYFLNNKVENMAKAGLQISGSDCKISGNIFYNCGREAIIGSLLASLISDNTFETLGTADPINHPCLVINSTGGLNVITSNTFKAGNTSQKAITTSGSGGVNVITNNIARYSATPYNLASGDISSVNITG